LQSLAGLELFYKNSKTGFVDPRFVWFFMELDLNEHRNWLWCRLV